MGNRGRVSLRPRGRSGDLTSRRVGSCVQNPGSDTQSKNKVKENTRRRQQWGARAQGSPPPRELPLVVVPTNWQGGTPWLERGIFLIITETDPLPWGQGEKALNSNPSCDFGREFVIRSEQDRKKDKPSRRRQKVRGYDGISFEKFFAQLWRGGAMGVPVRTLGKRSFDTYKFEK